MMQALRNQIRALLELPADLQELRREMRGIRTASEATLAALTRPRTHPHWAQLLVLWTEEVRKHVTPQIAAGAPSFLESQREAMPGCVTIAFDLNDPQIGRTGICSDVMQRPVPAGAWLVASGCLCSQVCVGSELQDTGSGHLGLPLRLVRLHTPIEVGMRLRARVLPDNGAEC